MIDLKLNLKTVDDYIPNLANQLKIGFKQELGEYKLYIPKDYGNGYLNCINFPNGIGLYIYKVNFKQEVKISIRHVDQSFVRFLYMLEGELKTQLTHRNQAILTPLEHYTVAPQKGNEQFLYFREKEETKFCYLEVDRRKFKEYCQFDYKHIEPKLQYLFNDINGTQEVFSPGNYGINVYNILGDIMENPLKGFPRINYMGGQSLTALSQMMINYQMNNFSYNFKNIKKEYLAVLKASSYINNNLQQLKNIKGIAEESGVNANKLQQGFKKFKGKSINNYIHDLRMQKAMQLLLKGENSVMSITENIGFKSRSYFAKSFKKRYGLSPKAVLEGQPLKDMVQKESE